MALLHLETRPIETSGVMETRAFTMKANGKAFKVLIDGLYSDKVRAVIRELCSNAYDAQIAAGRGDWAFDLHLPTVYEPHFSVRDYGTSMTHEDVMGLYTTVFESSKENSSTQVGKLGLGSKSPFAYTDTFTVTAFLNGEKRMYSAFIGSDYIPQIGLMSREATHEPDGIEVAFPVRDADRAAFEIAAATTLIGFDVEPKMTGAPLKKELRGKAVMQGTGWAIYEQLNCAYARQGCVIYPIDTNALPYTDARAVLNTGILIDFPIGSLEIAASREGLGYDQQTIDTIMAATDTIAAEMLTEALDKLRALPTIWDRMVFIHGMSKSDAPTRVIDALRKEVFGDTYTSRIKFNPFPEGALEFKSYNSDQIRRPSHPKRVGTPSYVEIEPDWRPLVVFNDMAQPAVKNHWGRLVEFVRNSPVRFQKAYVIRYDSRVKDTKAAFLAAADGAPMEGIVDLHTLPAPAPVPRTVSERIKARQAVSGSMDYWPSADVDLKAGGYYVPLSRGKIEDHSYLSGMDVWMVLGHLNDLGVLPSGALVYGILPSTKALKNGKWINVIELAKQTVAARMDEVATHNTIVKEKEDTFADRRTTAAVHGYLPPDHAIVRYHEERTWLAKYKGSDSVVTLRKLARKLAIDTTTGVSAFTAMEWADVTKPYPLLRELTTVNQSNIIDVADYVSLVDNRTGSRQAA